MTEVAFRTNRRIEPKTFGAANLSESEPAASWSIRSAGLSTGVKCCTHGTSAEIAAAEKINETYVGRVLRLTLLAPDIIEAILGGRQPVDLQLEDLLRRFPVLWAEQRPELLRSP